MTPEQAARLDDVLSGASRRRREEAALRRAIEQAWREWISTEPWGHLADNQGTVFLVFEAGYLAGMRAAL